MFQWFFMLCLNYQIAWGFNLYMKQFYIDLSVMVWTRLLYGKKTINLLICCVYCCKVLHKMIIRANKIFLCSFKWHCFTKFSNLLQYAHENRNQSLNTITLTKYVQTQYSKLMHWHNNYIDRVTKSTQNFPKNYISK